MDLEEHTVEPALEKRCAECGAVLTERELRDALESGGPFLCTVHAQEEVPFEDSEEFD
jgi:hypothetical protein